MALLGSQGVSIRTFRTQYNILTLAWIASIEDGILLRDLFKKGG